MRIIALEPFSMCSVLKCVIFTSLNSPFPTKFYSQVCHNDVNSLFYYKSKNIIIC